MSKTIERKEFLSLLGISASSLLLSCIGCSKGQGSSSAPPTNVNFTIDLTQSVYAALKTNGGYTYVNGILVAKTLSGSFIAVSQTCTHQNYTVNYVADQHIFYCSGHGGVFSESGQVQSGPPPAALKTYNASLSGNILTITG